MNCIVCCWLIWTIMLDPLRACQKNCKNVSFKISNCKNHTSLPNHHWQNVHNQYKQEHHSIHIWVAGWYGCYFNLNYDIMNAFSKSNWKARQGNQHQFLWRKKDNTYVITDIRHHVVTQPSLPLTGCRQLLMTPSLITRSSGRHVFTSRCPHSDWACSRLQKSGPGWLAPAPPKSQLRVWTARSSWRGMSRIFIDNL